MNSIPEIANLVNGECLVKNIKILPSGHLRIRTKLCYTDGSTIDFYVERESSFFSGVKLSDFGFTIAHLDESEVRPRKSPRRMEILNETIRSYGANLESDRLVYHAERLEDLPKAILGLGQACLAVSCMIFTKKTHNYVPFGSKVRDFLEKRRFRFVPNYKYSGPYGLDVRVDFRVATANVSTAILSMSGVNLTSSHNQSNEILSRWIDLRATALTDNLLTIHDENSVNYRTGDLRRLARVSKVLPLSDTEAISQCLLVGV